MDTNRENEKKRKGLKMEGSEQAEHEEALAQCQATLAEWQEKYTRLTADLENYKKRTIKERGEWSQLAQAKVLKGLLGIADNFDRAVASQPDVSPEMQSWVDGITMIHDSLNEYLKNAGITETSYETFNPEHHEALMQVDSEEHRSGEIVEVLEKGYMLGDRVLRPAKVSVAK